MTVDTGYLDGMDKRLSALHVQYMAYMRKIHGVLVGICADNGYDYETAVEIMDEMHSQAVSQFIGNPGCNALSKEDAESGDVLAAMGIVNTTLDALDHLTHRETT